MGSIFHNNFLKNSISHFNFFNFFPVTDRQTDRPTDRPTFGLIEAPLPELNHSMLPRAALSRAGPWEKS